MKKALFLFMVILTVVITSCRKDDSIDPNNLTGTTWAYSTSSNGVNYVETIKFTSRNNCTVDGVSTGATNYNVSLSGIYTYEPPDIYFEFHVEGASTLIGTINGNSLIIKNSGETTVYMKQ
ncbi:MAG: hypothetical protein Q8R96_10900 [Bacteroidota bacterium]|nr:hypothetical protein [Bacteroidota bacterium]